MCEVLIFLMTMKGIWAALAIAIAVSTIMMGTTADAAKDDLPNGQPFQQLESDVNELQEKTTDNMMRIQDLEETTARGDSFFDVFFEIYESPDSFFDVFFDVDTGQYAIDSFFDIFVELEQLIQEEQARIAADEQLARDLESEIARATAAEQELADALAQEILNRMAADNAEAAARMTEDQALREAIAQEIADRIAADADLQRQIRGLGENNFNVDSFFDVFYRIDLENVCGPGEIPKITRDLTGTTCSTDFVVDSFFDVFYEIQTEIVALQLVSHAPIVAGSGLIQSGDVFSTDPTQVQQRVTGVCAPGSSIRTINADGSVVCEIDSVGTGGGSDPFIGEIRMFGGTFAPRGWALCDGQLLPIAQHTALFSLLGTTYGGDGRTTFALPDLRGRVAVHPGTGPGLDPVRLGEKGGTEDINIGIGELPAHSHRMLATSTAADNTDPAGNVLAPNVDARFASADSLVEMAAGSIGETGSGNPIDNHQPFQGINYIIALEGVFPSRS